jgi:hypothetical protein
LASFECNDEQPEKRGEACAKDGDNEYLHGSGEAEPSTEHGHELGVAEPHAFSTADEPVEQANSEDDEARDQDGFETVADGLGDVCAEVVLAAGDCFGDGEGKAEEDAGDGEQVGEPEVFRIEGGEGGEQPGEQGVADEDDPGVGCVLRGRFAGEERGAEEEPDGCPEGGDG